MRINSETLKRRRSGKWLFHLAIMFVTLGAMTSAIAADWAPVADSGAAAPNTDAVRLNDGRVLYGVRLYDPATGQWSPTAGAGSGYLSTLTLLQDGRVLKTGHYDLFWFGAQPYNQLFDPNTNTWSDTTNSHFGHGGHLAVRLGDGRVLIAGISRDGGTAAEIFDPATESWTVTGNMNEEHVRGFIQLLDNGKVMVGGGVADYGNTASGIELYDPATGSWTSQANPPGRWRYPAATRLNDGRILVAAQSHSYLYDHTANSWSAAADLNVDHGGGFLLTLLADGQVLIAGGFDNTGYYAGGKVAEVYSPLADTWTRIGDMPENRANYGAALLPTGHVLLASGTHTDPTCCDVTSAILYTPAGTPQPPILPPPPPPPAPTPLHISDIDNVSDGGTLQWVPRVKFTVVDNSDNAVGGAIVTGEWSNGLIGIASCSTVTDGTCTIANLSYPNISTVPDPVFTITDVSRTDMVYDATANSDPDGDSDGTTITVLAPTPPPTAPTPGTVAVSDLDSSSVATSRRRWQATSTITVSDNLGNRVSNAVVSGSWSGGYSGSASCTTNSSGVCSVVTGNIANSKRSTTFTVANISDATLSYDAASNSDPDADSDGTSITVYKP